MGLLRAVKEAFTPTPESAARYYCTNCRREFTYPADLEDPDCPYCDSRDLQPVEGP